MCLQKLGKTIQKSKILQKTCTVRRTEQAKRSAELAVIIYCNFELPFTVSPVYVFDFERLVLATPVVDQG